MCALSLGEPVCWRLPSPVIAYLELIKGKKRTVTDNLQLYQLNSSEAPFCWNLQPRRKNQWLYLYKRRCWLIRAERSLLRRPDLPAERPAAVTDAKALAVALPPSVDPLTDLAAAKALAFPGLPFRRHRRLSPRRHRRSQLQSSPSSDPAKNNRRSSDPAKNNHRSSDPAKLLPLLKFTVKPLKPMPEKV